MAPIVLQTTATAVTTASRSPALTFANWTPKQNDVVVFSASSGAASAAATQPSGWVLPTPTSGANPVTSDSHTVAVIYHLVTSGEESGVTMTYTATNLWNATQTGNVTGFVLRGVDPANVIDSLVTAFDSGNTVTPHVLPALAGANVSTNSAIYGYVAKDATGTYTTPTGWDVAASFNTNLGVWLGRRVSDTVAGTAVSSTNITPSAGDEYASWTAAFTESAVTAPRILKYRDSGVANANSTSIVVDMPTDLTVGSMLMMTIQFYGAWTPSGLSAWTHQVTAGGTNARTTIYTRDCDGSESASYTVGGFVADVFAATVLEIGDHDGVDGTPTATNSGAGTWDAPSVTTTVNDSLVVRVMATAAQNIVNLWTWASSTPISDAWSGTAGSWRSHIATAAAIDATSGAAGTETVTRVGTSDSVWAAATIAFKPLPAGATGTLAAANQKATASFTGVMQPSGTLAAAMQKATAALTGSQTIPGTLAASNQKATASLTGVMRPSGVLAAAMQMATASMTGSQTQAGALAAALQALLFTGTGTQTQTGSLVAATQKPTAALSGWMEPSGTLAAALQKPTMAADGAQTQSGALAAATQILSASFTGTLSQSGVLAAALQIASASLSGGVTQSGTLVASIQELVFAASGLQTQQGTLAAAIKVLTASFTGQQTALGALAALIQPLEAELTGAVSGAPAAMFATMQPLTASLSGVMMPSGQLAAVLQPLVFNGQGSQTVTGSLAGQLQKPTASLTGQTPYTGTLSGLLVPALFSASGTQTNDGILSADLQELVAELTGSTPSEGVLAALLPALTADLEGSGGVPMGVLSASIAPLIFFSLAKVYRLALERLTAVEVQDRSARVSLQPRYVAVDAGPRTNHVEVEPRLTDPTVPSRNTTVKREG